jgi:hypothetical protein
MTGIKKSNMLAIAAGVLISPALMAAELDLGKHFIGSSYLGLTGPGDEVTTGFIYVQLGTEYAVGDKISLAFSGGSVIGDSFPNSVVVPCIAESVAGLNDGLAGMTWGRLNFDADQVTWRVTEIDSATCAGATSTDGVVVRLAENFIADFDAPAVAASGGVNVTFSAETGSGDPLDTGGTNRSDSTIDVGSEFDYTVAGFSGTIDVNTNRTTLIPGPGDSASVTKDPLDLSGGPYVAVTQVGLFAADYTWSGNFGWIVDANENTPAIDPQPGVVTVTNCASFTVSATAIAATGCSPFSTTLSLDPSVNTDVNGLVTLSTTSYSVEVDQDYTAFIGGAFRDGNIKTQLSAGSWDLNGFQAEVAYMPYQAGITQIIYFANRSKQDGEITVDWIGQDQSNGSFSIGDSLAGSTARLSDLIKNGLPEAQQTAGRLALTVTVNVPACEGQLNAQYNVSGDRAFSTVRDNCPVETPHD